MSKEYVKTVGTCNLPPSTFNKFALAARHDQLLGYNFKTNQFDTGTHALADLNQFNTKQISRNEHLI